MIHIERKEDCCGCGACFDVCPRRAISWCADDDGFSYPCVDTATCIDCGQCNKVCPIGNSDALNHHNDGFTPIVLAAYHKNEEIRFTSTSGGAFWGLAETWVKNGGYVAGAIFSDCFKVIHILTNDILELQKIKGSKYCQSDSRDMFKRISQLLKSGERVLATGLPCQMAGLRQYLRKDYDNLLIVDLICHSVPSPLLFEKYVGYLEEKHKGRLIQYHPKNKELGGWHHFSFKAIFDNGKIYNEQHDLFTSIAFANGYILSRLSCFDCRFKHFPQPSDITIGDFWGIENLDESFDSPKGVSKIILNNKKGEDYLKSLDCFVLKHYDAEEAVFKNPRAWSQITRLPYCDMEARSKMISNLNKNSFEFSVLYHTLPHRNMKQKIYRIIQLAKIKYNGR